MKRVVVPVRLHLRCSLLVLAAVLVGGCSKPAAAPPPALALDVTAFDGQRALYEIHELLAVGPRDATTPGAEKAATYLQRRLETMGVDATINAFIDATPRGPRTFRNVIARFPGRQPGLLIVGSHYDTKAGLGAGFLGANDSGSSSGVLIEMARVLAAANWTGPELQLVFFDGEEALLNYTANDGLHGSRHHAQQLVLDGRAAEVRAVIVLDMIGDRDLNVVIPRNSSPALAAAILRASHAEGVRSHFALYAYEVGDDHEPFLRAGMPAIDLIDFSYGSAPGRNDYWHTPQDTMDKLSAESLQIMGRVTLRALADLAAPPPAH